MLSHRLVQWVTKTKGINKAEQLYNILNERHFVIGQCPTHPRPISMLLPLPLPLSLPLHWHTTITTTRA